MMDESKRPSFELVENATSPADQSPILIDKTPVSLWGSVKIYPKIVGCCLGLTAAILLYGYDLAIVGTVSAMPEFQKDFGELYEDEWIIPSEWLALWNAASPIGVMFGAVVAGYLQDRAGRRWSLGVGSALSAGAVAICYVANLSDELNTRRGIFFLGKMFHGLAIGMVMATAQTYMSEILPPKLRGPILAFFPIFILLGQLAGAVVVFTSLEIEGPKSYTIPFASQWPFSAVLVVIAGVVPESPAYLLRKNKLEAAFKAQSRLDTKEMNTQAGLDRLLTAIRVEQEKTKDIKYADCFKGINRRRTWIVVFSHFLPQIFGLSLLSNASYFMQVVGMGASNSVLFLQLGIGLGLAANIASVWSLNVMGRRPLILLTLGITVLLWLGMGIAGCFTGIVMIWWTAVTMMVIIVICGIGVWPASYVVGGETSALHLRAKTQGVGWFGGGLATGIFSIVLPYMFNPDQGNLRAKTGFVFAALCVIGVVVSWFCVPEMKGRTAMEIDEMFELKLGVKEFKGWVSDQDVEQRDKQNNTSIA